MKTARILAIAVTLVVAVPLLVLNVWGARMSLWAVEQTRQFDTDTPNMTDPAPMPRNPLRFFHDRGELRDTFATDALTDQRSIVITEWIESADLLTAGEPLPDPTHLALYAQARAPQRMIRYCTEVIAAFGTACDVMRTEAQFPTTGPTAISAHLTYIPAGILGDPDLVNNGEFFIAPARLYEMRDHEKPPFNSESRIAAMQKAQDICDRLRETYGNCIVSRLDLRPVEIWRTDLERLPPGTDPIRLDATAIIKIYADKTQTANDDLRQIVQSLTTAD